MEWQGGRRSDNVVDAGRGGGSAPAGVRRGAVGIIGAILFYLLTGQVPDVQQARAPSQVSPQAQRPRSADDPQGEVRSVILADTEDTWTACCRRSARSISIPGSSPSRTRCSSECGIASAAVGPFYCSGDRPCTSTWALPPAGALGGTRPFRAGLRIAHEVGHHVQNLLGIERGCSSCASPGSRADSNALSV